MHVDPHQVLPTLEGPVRQLELCAARQHCSKAFLCYRYSISVSQRSAIPHVLLHHMKKRYMALLTTDST